MDFWGNYKKRLVSGSTVRDRRINDARHHATLYAPDSPAYKIATINDEEQSILVVSTAVPTEKIIRSMPGGDFTVGSIVYLRGSHWLITERDIDDDITVRGRIELCNRQLKWQNTKTGEIVSRWCTASKPYYSNLDETLKVTVSSREYKIQMPFDSETEMIALDKRFLVEEIAGEPKAYKTTSIDAITSRFDQNGETVGFLILNLTQDQYNPTTDNRELGICDYVEIEENTDNPEPPVAPSTPSASITFSGVSKIYTGGSWKTYTLHANSVPDEDLAAEWYIDISDEYVDKIELATEMNKCKVRALDFAELDGLTPILHAKCNITGAASSVKIEVICR